MTHAPFLRAFVALIPLLALTLAGCRGDSRADAHLPVGVRVAFAPTPPITGPNRLVITLTHPDGTPVAGAALRVEGTMNHAGMVPVFADAEEEGEGRYIVPEFDFTMGGDWILLLHLTLPDGSTGVPEHRVRVVSGGPGA